jgi:hypothetical protein
MLSPRSEWCYSHYTIFYLRIGILVMFDLLIRCNYLVRAPLQVLLIELTKGGRYVCMYVCMYVCSTYGKVHVAGSVYMRLKSNDPGIQRKSVHLDVNSVTLFCLCIAVTYTAV